MAELEKQDARKITSESYHTGFDSSLVSKPEPKAEAASDLKRKNQETVEVLNPGSIPHRPQLSDADVGQSSGADADIEDGALKDGDESEEEHIEPSALGKRFGQIKYGDYRACLQFISENPSVLAEQETDGLLVKAFDSQLAGKYDMARQYVHQALLLQYCRSLGRDGVALFFKRITTKNHKAQEVFNNDVRDTYARIRTRAAEIQKQREQEKDEGGVEQIQLHAVDPNTTINIAIPPPLDSPQSTEDTRPAREIFESFPPGLRRALEIGKLDEVNKVLAKMSVEEAEEIVGKMGEGGMLSLEEKIIDATTDEGREVVKEIERTGRMPGQSDAAEIRPTLDVPDDPGMD